ncbi:hypothetical protein Psi01_82530 [Planobispora siamensis]|uniref:Uncharacterized protein n=1 Tax=Planobispora siamensis TaxID=936338 RepID=A0A8J3WPU2_9ACTN|nr:hypothetical protein Psi01_82530 [Planobispora siamensis]
MTYAGQVVLLRGWRRAVTDGGSWWTRLARLNLGERDGQRRAVLTDPLLEMLVIGPPAETSRHWLVTGPADDADLGRERAPAWTWRRQPARFPNASGSRSAASSTGSSAASRGVPFQRDSSCDFIARRHPFP